MCVIDQLDPHHPLPDVPHPVIDPPGAPPDHPGLNYVSSPGEPVLNIG